MPAANIVESLEVRRLLSNSLIADFGGIYPTESVTLNGISYFAADDGAHGVELWRSDGTPQGTKMVRDLLPGSGSSEPGTLSVVNDRVVLLAVGQSNHLIAWSSDGTADGTIQLKDFGVFVGGVAPNYLMDGEYAVVGSPNQQKLVFGISLQSGLSQTWSTDGTVGGTIKLLDTVAIDDTSETDLTPHATLLPVSNGHVIFSDGQKLWSTDGTLAGTEDLSAISTAFSAAHGIAEQTFQFGDKVAFISHKGLSAQALWLTDGTDQGTVSVVALDPPIGNAVGQTNFGVQVMGGKMYVIEKLVPTSGGGEPIESELWASDGTGAGSFKLMSVSGDAFGEVGQVGNDAIFDAPTGKNSYALFVSDGTTAGTVPIKTLLPFEGFFQFHEAGGYSYFLSLVGRPHPNVGEGGHYQLWRSDGTVAGTVLVSNMTDITEEKYIPRMTTASDEIAIELIRVGDSQEHIAKTLIVDPTHNAQAVGPHEALETLKDSVLRIFGTLHSDTIRIYDLAADPTRFIVNLNGVTRSFAYADVRKVIIYGYSGNDFIDFSDVHGPVVMRSLVYGGAGNDTLEGSDGRDTLSGDGGDDVISSGNGNDLVMGGDGTDTIDGGSGADMISGGSDGSQDSIDGGAGTDVIFGQAVYDIFYGTDKSDGILSDDFLNN
jgi:ELWxxDGT repeat protein